MRLDQFETERSVGPHGFVKFMGVLIDVEDENIIMTPGAPDQQGFFFNEANLNLDRLIAKAARTSYTHGTTRVRDDAKLIDYLMRHHHTSPFEMCLSGDTLIPIMPAARSDGKGYSKQKSYTLRELAEAFEAGGKQNAWVKQVKIRTVNPDGTVTATRIKRAWRTGRKPVYRITEDSPLGRSILATDNHPFLTPSGYKTVRELNVGDEVVLNGRAMLDSQDLRDLWERGFTLQDIAEQLGVSKTTAYKRLKAAGVDTSRRSGVFRRKLDEELSDPHAKARTVRPIAPGTTCENCRLAPAVEVHHLDENPHNNNEDNLVQVCRSCHKAFHGATPLFTYTRRIKSIELVGEEDVYDLEVESENHNFVANGFVVHNCEFKFLIRAPLFVVQQFLRHRTASVNQESARYSMLEDLEFLPEPKDWRKPGLFNKQGSQYLNEEEVEVIGKPAYTVAEEALRHSYAAYQTLLDLGVSRELARIVLPTATYTKFVWKIDLHNLLRFLKLRLDDTAQEEIRHYAMAILEMIRPFVPHTIESWENHVLNACTLSADELTVVREIIKHHYAVQSDSDVQLVSDLSAAGLSASRIREFKAKLRLIEPS